MTLPASAHESWLCLPLPQGSHFTAGQTPAGTAHVFAKSHSYRNVWAAGGKMVLLSEPHRKSCLATANSPSHPGFIICEGLPHPWTHSAPRPDSPVRGDLLQKYQRCTPGKHVALFKALLLPLSPWVFLTPSGDRKGRNYQRKKPRNREGKCWPRSHQDIDTSRPQTETTAPSRLRCSLDTSFLSLLS